MLEGQTGWLRVVTGPMFAGKSEDLLRRIRRARKRGEDVVVVTHALDDRYGRSVIASHTGLSTPAHAVADVGEIPGLLSGRAVDLLVVDEAQFFGVELVPVLDRVLAAGVSVTVAGLCMTFAGGPYEPIATLMAHAEEITKLTAVCEVCGRDAAFHQLRHPEEHADAYESSAARVGGAEMYEARCRRHFTG